MTDFFDEWLAAQNRIVAAKLALTAALHQQHMGAEEILPLYERLLQSRREADELLEAELLRRRRREILAD